MIRFAVLLLMATAITGCASAGAVPRPFPVPGGHTTPPVSSPAPVTPDPSAPAPAVPPPASSRSPRRAVGVDGYSISSTALSFRGTPYRNGGTDPAGFDCSGFVQYVFAQHGVTMPRDVRNQFGVGSEVDATQLEPGDLVFFTTVAPGASHVGIIVGGDQFVHAPNSTGVVRVEHLTAQYWANRFVGAKRVN